MKKEHTLLLTAYAVNPYKGSEDGTGWNISKELAKTHTVYVVTRKNNREEIERYMREQDDPTHRNMHFHYYDLPYWLMFWKYKLGERGYVLYFYLWQLFLPLFVKRQRIKFDVAHAINFHSDSHPQFLWMLGKPVFWGPIGHHPPVPRDYLYPIYGFKNWLKDRLYNTVKFIMRRMDPFYYISKWTAKRIFVINSGINKAVKANPKKVVVLPAVAHVPEKKKIVENNSDYFTVLAVGRFVYMKGFDITIRAFASFYHSLPHNEREKVRLQLVGKGEEMNRMQALVEAEGITGAVEILQWVPKEQMAAIYQNANVFCFGSHEGAGMVVPEALSYGLPVVCFDNYGPGELCDTSCAIKVPYAAYNTAVKNFSIALQVLYQKPLYYKRLSFGAKVFAHDRYSWSEKAKIVSNAYKVAI